ncbi:RpoD subfamily RNA polymerase sigma-70 subunit [Nitzschia inconspicua]|uniref:RpoD subfamily RNA polymerase sigma-70 subunit n=1 Tax=Nitzschia inconspicua TaxID=303405 RepID=A0A9K3LMC5_9STRA|nr:RpoD subfamily RNA polymerase sigma-70 subunit [Nitzschia inconspicua]
MTPIQRSRKRSLSSPSSCYISRRWISAAVVVLGSLLVQMDSLAVIAFAPVQSKASSTIIVLDSSDNRKMRPPLSPNKHPQNYRITSRSATLFDRETSSKQIPSLDLLTSSIREEERKRMLSLKSLTTQRIQEAATKKHNQHSQELNFVQGKEAASISLGNSVTQRSDFNPKIKQRKQIVKSNAHKSGSRRTTSTKKRILKSIRTFQIEDMRLSDKKKKNDRRFLSREEERQLTLKVRSLRRAVRVRDSLVQSREEWSSVHPAAFEDDFPTEQQWAEACGLSVMDLRRVMTEGQESRSVLVSANTGLVTSIAKRQYYALKHATEVGGGVGTILTLQDMIQEGNLGLMKAAERFDADRGFRFSTYATYWIRQRILQSISDSSRVIRLPAHVHAQLQKINKARKQVTQDIGRVPSDPELAHFMKMSVDDLRKIISKAQMVVSLESPIRKGTNHKSQLDERTIGDFIASETPTPFEDAQRLGLQHEIQAVMNDLTERERRVLTMRYGLENGEPMSMSQTAHEIGISLDQVRHVEAKALTKLRCPQRNYRLKEYVGGPTEDFVSSAQVNSAPERHVEKEKMWFF